VKGRFITFEGIEGSGKSSQIVLFAEYLRSHRYSVRLTREPGGTLIGDQVRRILLDPENKSLDPLAELLLYAASRAQHLKEVIRPALDSGMVVLCDRFADATVAYQGYGRGLDLNVIQALHRIVTAGMRPDLTIVLDVDAETGLSRARRRNSTQGLEEEARFENEDIAFHNRVREGYRALAGSDPERVRIVDASGNHEQVQASIREVADGLLSGKQER
jgi:dTMP kinase